MIGIRNLPQITLERPPRLADFAAWVSASEQAIGMRPGEAIAACQANSAETRNLALEASPLCPPLVELSCEGFTGAVAELPARLETMVGTPCIPESEVLVVREKAARDLGIPAAQLDARIWTRQRGFRTAVKSSE